MTFYNIGVLLISTNFTAVILFFTTLYGEGTKSRARTRRSKHYLFSAPPGTDGGWPPGVATGGWPQPSHSPRRHPTTSPPLYYKLPACPPRVLGFFQRTPPNHPSPSPSSPPGLPRPRAAAASLPHGLRPPHGLAASPAPPPQVSFPRSRF